MVLDKPLRDSLSGWCKQQHVDKRWVMVGLTKSRTTLGANKHTFRLKKEASRERKHYQFEGLMSKRFWTRLQRYLGQITEVSQPKEGGHVLHSQTIDLIQISWKIWECVLGCTAQKRMIDCIIDPDNKRNREHLEKEDKTSKLLPIPGIVRKRR